MFIYDTCCFRDVLPLKSAYPRKDFVINNTENYDCNVTSARHSYLYQLTEHATENTWDQLFLPSRTCSRGLCNNNDKYESKKNYPKPEKDVPPVLQVNL